MSDPSFRKRGFTDLVDRVQRDPQFSAAIQNLVPEALRFIERLAGCISPTIESQPAKQTPRNEALKAATAEAAAEQQKPGNNQPSCVQQGDPMEKKGIRRNFAMSISARLGRTAAAHTRHMYYQSRQAAALNGWYFYIDLMAVHREHVAVSRVMTHSCQV